jgi:4'-phosphopantetheinyl transferase
VTAQPIALATDATQVDVVTLERDGWRGRAAMAWVPASQYEPLAARAADFLGHREHDTFRAFEFLRRRAAYLLGRYAAKTALAAIAPHLDPRAIDIVPGCFQQPVVEGGTENIGVSISHTASAACAVAFPDGHPMGIDLEGIDASRVDVMRTQLSAKELELSRASADTATITTVMWTAKEALSKTLRCGMTVPFALLAVEGVEPVDGGFSGTFRNFAQYRYAARTRDGAVMTIVLPRKTVLLPALEA